MDLCLHQKCRDVISAHYSCVTAAAVTQTCMLSLCMLFHAPGGPLNLASIEKLEAVQ